MDAVYTGITWSARRLIALFAAVLLAALIAGGFGGYLIRGGAASTISISAPATHAARALSGPLTEPHDGAAARAVSAGLTEPHDGVAAGPAAAGLTEPHDDGR